jgi:hypothetical protein
MFCRRNEPCGLRFRRGQCAIIAIPARQRILGRADALAKRDAGRDKMGDFSTIREHMEVIGADGVHVGTVDHVEGDRIKLTKKDSGQGSHEGHHHYISRGLVADVEGDQVRLSANADVALTFEEEEGGEAR